MCTYIAMSVLVPPGVSGCCVSVSLCQCVHMCVYVCICMSVSVCPCLPVCASVSASVSVWCVRVFIELFATWYV